MLDKKPNRYKQQITSPAPEDYIVGLHKVRKTVVRGGESNSHFIDVVSLGPIGGIQDVYLDETPLSSGEFPRSLVYVHDGDGANEPWGNRFPYVERTISLGKNAEITALGDYKYSYTTFQRKVTSVGVVGLRINFTTSGFTQKDDRNRNKDAYATFKIEVLNSAGDVVSTASSPYDAFHAKNPTAIQLYVEPPSSLVDTLWEYRVEIGIQGTRNGGVSVGGNWTASTATEVYRDTQIYDKIAYASGTIVARDVSGRIPKRQYLADGYKVLVPDYQTIGGNQVLTGTFHRETSDSHAWNAMAVITDTLWGAGQPIDKIDVVTFHEFDKYCKQIVGGDQRYSFSQYLIKSDNYYKLASEMVGAADGRLYEDGSGRIGVLVDKQTSNRRVVTSYDIVDEMVKRTTVSEEKKINYVEAEFEDRDNLYKKTIIHVEDDAAIIKNGVISKNLKLDTCTRLSEAQRTIKKMLVTSQVATSSYVLKVGHTHEDVQIGEVLEVYDRKFANINYCGKVAAGSTLNIIQVDPRTPINLTGIKQPIFTMDNSRGVPIKVAISSWTSTSITLATNLLSIPVEYTSFGVDDGDISGVKPTLIRVLGVDDTSGVLSLEGVEYNDSLYSHVDDSSPLIIHNYKYIPEQTTIEITNLQLTRTISGITASWGSSGAGYGYGYNWKFTPVGGTTSYIGTGVTDNLQVSLPNPLNEGVYEIQVLATLNGESVGDYSIATLSVGVSEGSILPSPTGLSSLLPDGTLSTNFVGREFTVRWDQVEDISGVTVSHFKLRVLQGLVAYEVVVDKTSRQCRFAEEVLTSQFGSLQREFVIQLITVDSELKTTEIRQVTITNPVPPLPNVEINAFGSLTLSYGGTLPSDLTGTLVRVWEGDSQFEPIPLNAVSISSSELVEIPLPSELVRQDGTSYVFDVVWVDSFGSDGTNHGRSVFSFDPNAQTPVSPELYEAVPIDSQTVMIKYTHSGLYLKRLQASYRRYGTTTWTTLAEVFTVPPVDSDSGYDPILEDGYVRVSGLLRNIEYEFKLNVANTSGLYSEDSNYIAGSPYLDVVSPDEVLPQIDDIISSIGEIDVSIDGIDLSIDSINTNIGEINNSLGGLNQDVDSLKLSIASEVVKREVTDKALFDTAASAVQLRQDLSNGLSGLTDAVFEVDPATGLINLRTYSYTDNAFNQAGLLIDGVAAEVAIQASRVTDSEGRITKAESQILTQAGQISLKASYSEVNDIVSGAIDAVLPAYTFGFFNSNEGWSAVNGTLSQGVGSILLTTGDIQNQNLNYSADDNPIISLSIERTAGAGWVGDLIVTFSGGGTQTYSNVIANITTGSTMVRLLNLGSELTYTGTVTGIRLKLGATPSDTFTVSNITIGKPSATLEALDGLTAQVNQLGINIDAVNGSLSNYVTTTSYEANSVTFSNLDVTLDGADAIINLRATQQEIDNNNVVTKANEAAIWIDASEANITQVVQSYNAQVGGIDDQLEDIDDTFTIVQSEIDATNGLIRDQSLSINRLGNKDKDIEKNAFYAAELLLKQRNGLLDAGESIAIADRKLQTITNDVGALSQELLNLEASTGSELGQLDSKIFQLAQVTTSKDVATALTLSSLTATVNSNTAGITSTQQAIADESSARTTAIDSLTATVNSNTASIASTNQALATETSARVSAISSLTTKVDSNTAEITEAKQAIVDEANARVTAIQQLTVQVGDDIALVDTNAKAAIGYCTIGGSFSSHETKSACQAVGGTWTNSTLATATRTVQVSSGGQTATVGSFYSSYVNLAGEITGKAVMGVDVNGAFTGMEVVGGNNYSQLTFKGNTIRFQNTSGVDQLVYDNSINTWKFFGTIYAENITGDVTDSIVVPTKSVWVQPTSNPNTIFNILAVNYTSMPFNRYIVVSGIPVVLDPNAAILFVSSRNSYTEDGYLIGKRNFSDVQLDDSSGQISRFIPANESGYFTVGVKRWDLAGFNGGATIGLNNQIPISIFKKGSSLSERL